MNGPLGYIIFKILPTLAVLCFTLYLAYIVTSPTRLRTKISKHKGTPKYDLYHKIYNKQFLGAWVCVTLFCTIGIAYDIYNSTHTPSIVVVYANLILIFVLLFTGGSLMSRALKK